MYVTSNASIKKEKKHMKKIKAFLCGTSFLMAALPALTSCGAQEKHDYWVKIWCDTKIQSLTTKQAKAWAEEMAKEENGGFDIGIKVDPVGEGTAAANMISDVESGADLFFFAQDQLNRLVSSNAVVEIKDAAGVKNIVENNDAFSLTAASITDKQGVKHYYSYPVTSDNSFFMYYDKSFFPDATVLADLDRIMEKCQQGGKKVYFNLTDAWNNASVFYGFGCQSEWKGNPDGTFYDVDDTYSSKAGQKACKAIYRFVNTYKNTIVNDSTSSTAFSHKPGEAPQGAVCISGTWDYNDVKSLLGDNMGAIKLPSITQDGETFQLRPFLGCKLLGVKPQKDAKMSLFTQLLAERLTGKQCQLDRFNENGWGPSNLEAQKDPAVLANPALVALAGQKEFSVSQGQYPLDWWDAAAGIAKSLADDSCNGTDDEIKAILTKYKQSLASMINGQEPED